VDQELQVKVIMVVAVVLRLLKGLIGHQAVVVKTQQAAVRQATLVSLAVLAHNG
jgi:hypothetical protein